MRFSNKQHSGFWELFVQMSNSNNHQIKLTVCFFVLDLIWFLWLCDGLAFTVLNTLPLYCLTFFTSEKHPTWSLWRVLDEGCCPESQAQSEAPILGKRLLLFPFPACQDQTLISPRQCTDPGISKEHSEASRESDRLKTADLTYQR